jgi:hypothetical protein
LVLTIVYALFLWTAEKLFLMWCVFVFHNQTVIYFCIMNLYEIVQILPVLGVLRYW